MKRSNKLVWVLGAAAVVALTWWLTRTKTDKTATEEQAPKVKVEKGAIQGTVVATGTMTAQTTVDVKANSGGEVLTLLVEVGDKVKKGDLLATIDPTDSLTAVNTSNADLRGTRAQAAVASANMSQEAESRPAREKAALEAIAAAKTKVKLADETLALAKLTSQNAVDSAGADVTSTGARRQKASTSAEQVVGSSAAALRAAQQSRQAAEARVAQAQASLDLAKETYETDLARARSNRASAAARLASAKLSADTTPAQSHAAVNEAREAVTASSQRLERLVKSTHPTAAAGARGDFDAAKTALTNAQADLRRQRELYQKGFVPLSGVEAAEATLATAQSRFDTADQTVKTLTASQAAERAEAEAAVSQARASLKRAEENARATGTTGFDVQAAEAALAVAEQDVRKADNEKISVTAATAQLKEAQASLAQANAQVDSAQAGTMDVLLRGSDLEDAKASERKAAAARSDAEANRRVVRLRELDLEAARAAQRQAEANYLDIFSQRFKLEQYKGSREQALAAGVRYEATLEQARKQLRDCTILAPRDGVVITRYVERGSIITGSRGAVGGGTTICTLADITDIYCNAQVNEADVAQVQAGQEATLTAESFGERPFPAKVRKVYPQGSVVSNVTMFTVELVVTGNITLLRPGMTADISIFTRRKEDVLILPSEAVREGASGYFVVVEGGQADKADEAEDAAAKAKAKAKAKRASGSSGAGKGGGGAGALKLLPGQRKVKIKVGIQTAKEVEIVSGLKEGDEVVLPATAGGADRDKKSANDQFQKSMKMGMKGMGIGK